MNIVRCRKCGEISDVERSQTCRGCGEPLSAAPAGKRPRQISAVQREASDDIDHSNTLLLALLGAGGLGVALIFIKEYGFTGVVLAIGLAAAVLVPTLRWMKKRGAAASEVPAYPKAPRVPSARLADPGEVVYSGSRGSSLEQGCGMVLKVIGIFILVILGLLAVGIAILWISCMGSSWGHF
jgi:hypothetical protein